MTQEVHTDVLVVGAGLTGLTAALTLASRGVRTTAISRHPRTSPQPRASITNQRTLEIMRNLGIEDRVMAVATPLRELNHNVMATSLTGQEIARYEAYGTAERFLVHQRTSPCEKVNLGQHRFEPVLLDAARERGADVWFSHELITITHDADGVEAVVRHRGTLEEMTVHARYAIGADGGRSAVAEQIGFRYEGEAGLRHMMNYWIEADLTPYTAYRPATMYIIAQPGEAFWSGSGTLICVTPFTEWVLAMEYDPANDEPKTSEEHVTARVRNLVGDPTVEVRLKDVSRWQVNNIVATEYRHGPIFLAGDAAHKHPPAGGLGGNTSIQDAFNLSCKLASVLAGEAGPGLLDAYEQERQPIGRQVVDRAFKSMGDMLAMVKAFGFERGQSTAEGQAQLDELFAATADGERRRGQLLRALRLQDHRSNAQGIELGQRYTSTAVIDDGTPFPESDGDPELYYHRTTHPGAHLPHAWVERDRRTVSTLDLVGAGRYTLITGIGGQAWADAAASVATEIGVNLPVREIGVRCEYDDVLGDWTALREISDSGALLVRPDMFVGWRSATLPEHPREALYDALTRLLHRAEDAAPALVERVDATAVSAT